jgi:tetratricopeptide (TPR) repeat protein
MTESLEVAVAFAQAGRIPEAEKICHDALRADPSNARALLLLASTANARKAHHHALDLLQKIGNAELAPVYVEKAVAHLGLGAVEMALREARRAIEISPDVPRGYWLVSHILMPGESYYAVLQRFHDRFKPRNYLEIGVDQGASIILAKPPTVAIGIDPEPRLFKGPKTVCKIFPLQSDDYFACRDVRRDLEGDSVDLAFIDGLHTFDQALRDFINIERFAGVRTVVLIHDCLAVDALTAARERKTAFWTGDVWKIIPILRECRPDLNVFTIATPPSGLGVVSGLDPHSRILSENFVGIVARYASMPVDPDQARRRQQAAVVPNNWDEVETRLVGGTR